MNWDTRRFTGIKETIVGYMATHGNVPVDIEKVARDTGLSIDEVRFFHEVMQAGGDLRPGFIARDDSGRPFFLHRNDHAACEHYIAQAGVSINIGVPTASTTVRDKARVTQIDQDIRKWSRVMHVLTMVYLIVAACVVAVQLVPAVLARFGTMAITSLEERVVDAAGLVLVSCLSGCGGLIALHVDARMARRVEKGLHSGYGTGTLVAGIIGCFAWGAGIPLLVKGAGILWLESERDELLKRTVRGGMLEATRGLNGTCWRLVMYVASLQLAGAGLAIARGWAMAGLPSLPDTGTVAIVVLAVLGLVGGGVYKTKVFRQFKAGEIRSVATTALACGIVSTACFGSGVPMIFASMLLYHAGSIVNEAARSQRKSTGTTRDPEREGHGDGARPLHAEHAGAREGHASPRPRGFVYDLFASPGTDSPGSSDLFKREDDEP